MSQEKDTEMSIIRQWNIVTNRKANWTPLMCRCYVTVLGLFSAKLRMWRAVHPKNVFGDDDTSMLLDYMIPVKSLDETGNIQNVKRALHRLCTDVMEIGDVDSPDPEAEFACFSFLSGVRYMRSRQAFRVCISPLVVPFFVEILNKFTYYDPIVARQFAGKYTQRFYEWCAQWRDAGHFFLEIAKIRECLKLGGKYGNLTHLMQYVVQPSCEEMSRLYASGSCDICFTWRWDETSRVSRGGRPTHTRIVVDVEQRERKREPLPAMGCSTSETQRYFEQIFVALTSVFSGGDTLDRTYPQRVARPVIALLRRDRGAGEAVMQKIREVCANDAVTSKAAYLRRVLEREWGLVARDEALPPADGEAAERARQRAVAAEAFRRRGHKSLDELLGQGAAAK